MSLIRNRPSPEGASLGEHLANMTDAAERVLRQTQPAHPERCGTCAFRRGTVPNQCAATVMDALKCVMEKVPFHCHEHEGEKPCMGFVIASSPLKDSPAIVLPWDFSLSEEDE